MTEALQLDLLVFAAHPDDAEIGMGGTIAREAAAGRKVGIVDLTKAEMSSNGTVEIRQREAREAAEVLGLAVRENLGLPDRGLALVEEQIRPIVAVIRRWRPRVVFAPYPADRHPDHVRCGQMVEEAVFNAKLRRYMPEMPAWQVEALYFYMINDVHPPQFIVDVSGVYDRKRRALGAYRSQFDAPDARDGRVSTPLTDGYLERVEARDRLFGQPFRMAYAEGFMAKGPVVITAF